MKIVIQYPITLEEKNNFKLRVAYFKAIILYESVNKLIVDQDIKRDIFDYLLDSLDTYNKNL